MEDIPPSYNNINPNVLDLLPPYLSTASLVNLCLVSRAYYAIYIPHLWGSPASHFVEVANQSSRTTNGINFANLQVSGSQNDMVYVALTRFKRILRKARLSTRQLCHTLHLPPALSEIYGGPNSTWLREVLDWLPALQSLCVSGLPFFDHDSLLAVDQYRTSSMTHDPNDENFRRYPVKLLLAAKEPNVTWSGLSLLIPHLPDLVYLDLSYTSPARNVNVLRSFDALRHLQVLKLRGIGLKDNELEVLSQIIGLRVRLLDIAENQLSDRGVGALLQSCLWLPSTRMSNGLRPSDRYSRSQFESWPVGLPPPPDSLSLNTIRNVELDEALLNQLTSPLTGRLAFEDIPHGGITHLYISGNPRVTVESLKGVLDLGRLHVLDAGEVGALAFAELQQAAMKWTYDPSYDQGTDGTSSYVRQQLSDDTRQMARLTKQAITSNLKSFRNRARTKSNSAVDLPLNQTPIEQEEELDLFSVMPSAEKLVPVLQEKASKNLTHLRIDHTLATSILDISRELKEREKRVANMAELQGSASLPAEVDAQNRQIQEVSGSTSYAVEMPGEAVIYEMDATPAPTRVELPGDMIHLTVVPPQIDDDRSYDSSSDVLNVVRGEGAMAPEVNEAEEKEVANHEDEPQIILNATGSGVVPSNVPTAQPTTTQGVTGNSTTSTHSIHSTQGRESLSRGESTGSQTMYTKEIESLTSLRPHKPFIKLHPSFLPNLRTLILTSLPPTVLPGSTLIHNLKEFITDCASEARLAVLKARTNYSLPPGRARQDAERQHARRLFALTKIVLEVGQEIEENHQRGWKTTRQRLDVSKSSTGDRDSEALWSAAENDFSFFGEEGEESAECGVYAQEPDKYFPTISFDEKIALSPDEQRNGYYSSPQTPLQRVSSPSTSSSGPFTPTSSLVRNITYMQSPRNLPLGRNRRTSNELYRPSPAASDLRLPPRSQPAEMPGTIPAARTNQSLPNVPSPEPPQKIDVIAELAKWRRERKAAYEQAFQSRIQSVSRRRNSDWSTARLAELDVYVEGHWAGEIKVIRTNKQATRGRLERTGNVDVFGNYFERGYLYP